MIFFLSFWTIFLCIMGSSVVKINCTNFIKRFGPMSCYSWRVACNQFELWINTTLHRSTQKGILKIVDIGMVCTLVNLVVLMLYLVFQIIDTISSRSMLCIFLFVYSTNCRRLSNIFKIIQYIGSWFSSFIKFCPETQKMFKIVF